MGGFNAEMFTCAVTKNNNCYLHLVGCPVDELDILHDERQPPGTLTFWLTFVASDRVQVERPTEIALLGLL